MEKEVGSSVFFCTPGVIHICLRVNHEDVGLFCHCSAYFQMNGFFGSVAPDFDVLDETAQRIRFENDADVAGLSGRHRFPVPMGRGAAA